MTGVWRGLAVALMLAGPVLAELPLSSLRPLPRPMVGAVLPPVPQTEIAPTARPAPRPDTAFPVQAPVVTAQPLVTDQPVVTAQPDASIQRMVSSLRPLRRPAQIEAEPGVNPVVVAAAAPQPGRETRSDKRAKASKKGSVCGVAAIKGEQIARISSKVKGCGIDEPVRITSVSGVRLSQAATLDCDTAKALNRWVESGLQPAFGRAKVIELRVAAHYICRSRNNIRGARISEHGRGKAIDIAAVTLENGKTVSVLGGFGKELRRAHKAACGIFTTTLGPGSDGFHEDHLHYDTASHRSGAYCR